MQVKLMLIISALDKVAVPLFFMISGALLLPKRETLKRLLQKRVARFVVVILLFHIVQSTYYCVGGGENGIGIRSFLSDCYWGGMEAWYLLGWTGACAVWFLYAYVGLLLTLPFLRLMVKDMEESHFFYLFGLQIALCVMCPAVFVLLTGHTPAGRQRHPECKPDPGGWRHPGYGRAGCRCGVSEWGTDFRRTGDYGG